MKADARLLLVPAFLLMQPFVANYVAGSERRPAAPDLSSFATRIGNWESIGEDPLARPVLAELAADRVMNRVYRERGTHATAGVFVAWFQSQRDGARQPHSPKVCLPAAGWTPLETTVVDLQTPGGAIPVNRNIVSNGAQRAVAMYWYETPRRVIASEWAAKFWLIADGIRDRRTDTALARVFVWSRAGEDAAAVSEAADLSSQLEPELRRMIRP